MIETVEHGIAIVTHETGLKEFKLAPYRGPLCTPAEWRQHMADCSIDVAATLRYAQTGYAGERS
jgi:hypothetical protein